VGQVTNPKTKQSKAPVPVIGSLAKKLETYRLARGNPESGLMFASLNGTPLNVDNLANRTIKPALTKAGLGWHGWHAFRRGLATNLYRLGVADKTIQSILRHANVTTTMNIYVKSVPADAAAAMRSLEQVCTQYAPNPASPETGKSIN
jgi:integrase